MSQHIIHLLSHDLRVRCELDRLIIRNRTSAEEKVVPLQDIAIIIAAAPDFSVTGVSLRRMAELGVLLLICNERFEPACLNVPYYRGTDTHLLRKQVEWSHAWKRAQWRQIITSKVEHQAMVLSPIAERGAHVLKIIAERCASGTDDSAPVDLSKVTVSRREGLHATTPEACESRAARNYWQQLIPRLSALQGTQERRRDPGTRDGVNGMLDYGYAIVRTAVLRSLAAHGFIAALGIAHTAKAGSHALADDLMEPLRPFIDLALWRLLQTGPQTMQTWVPKAAGVLTETVKMGGANLRLINAIDLYVQSFANATLHGTTGMLRIPPMPKPSP
jgi:CRISPR-associated protein Cas1